ncbi:MAG: hypothetical protein QM811_28695 [Pirellulales bacterium]
MIRILLLATLLPCLTSWASAVEPQPVELDQLRLYVPIPELEDRFGSDIKPLATYVKALEKRSRELLEQEKPPKAKGLLVAVGMKSKASNRIWCEAVDGDMPAELLKRIEKELALIEGVDLKKGPAGFALEVKLFGQKPEKYPEFPSSWIEAAKKHQTPLSPPDELFKNIWPD